MRYSVEADNNDRVKSNNNRRSTNLPKDRTLLERKFVIFSVTLFLLILVIGSAAFFFAMRQIIRENHKAELSRVLDIQRIKIENAVKVEIAIALKLADSPLIKRYFANPFDLEMKELAFEEIASYGIAFTSGILFWVNDIDRMFYTEGNDPYWLDAEKPENYWYNMTLHETEGYNFNINYNPDINAINLWINAPVFDDNNKPVGMVGTGIGLSDIMGMIYDNAVDREVFYFFNTDGEITAAPDMKLVEDKMKIEDEVAHLEIDIFSIIDDLDPGEILTIDTPSGKVAIGSIPLLEWYSIAILYDSMQDYNTFMTALFSMMLILILLVLIIFNVLIARYLKSLRNAMGTLDNATEAELRTQEFISSFSVPFTQAYDFDELIGNALFDLRDFTGTDRAIILELQPEGYLLCTHENIINEKTPRVRKRSLSCDDFRPTLDEADKTGCFYVRNASRYFSDHPKTDLGEKSFCYIPLMIGGTTAGYLVFFTMFEQANWAEGEFRLATMAGSIIAGAYSRKKSEDIMLATNEVELRTQEFISKFSAPFTQPYDFDELIDNALFELRDFTGTDRAIILEFQPDGGLLCTHESVINAETPRVLNRSLSFDDFKLTLEEADKTGCFYIKNAAGYFTERPTTDLGEKSFCYIPLTIGGTMAGYLVFFTMFVQANWAEGEFRLATMAGSIIAGAYSRMTQQEKLQSAIIEAQTANEAKSEFLASMSHEIRTPMNAILGMSELLLSENMSKRQLDYATDIQSSSLALLDIINDILDLSKIQSGKLHLIPVHYDFSYLIDNVSSIAQFLIEKKKDNLSFRLQMKNNAHVCLFGDNIRLRQVLLNLLSNAVKFTEKGYVKLAVDISDDTVIMTVSDTGIGIPADNMDVLFEAFEQADILTNRNIKGTGLGLTITKSIIEMMGGEVTVESEYGKGTSFTVVIPKVLGDENLIQKIDNSEDIISAPDAKVLVIDDNQTNLNVASGLLQICQIIAETALSGKQAIEMVQKNEYDIVFMDHMMPEMDGIEATKIIRELGIDTPIVALTASAVFGMKEMMLESGMNDYLSKPIIKSELIRVLKTWIPADKITETSLDADSRSDSYDESRKEFWEYVEHIEELYITMGLNRVYGQRSVYEKTLRLTISEIAKSDKNLREFLTKSDMESFRIEVHGIKGVLANIGAMDLSSKAYELEKASEIPDVSYCVSNLDGLLDSLSRLSENLIEAFSLIRESEDILEVPVELSAIFNNLIIAVEDVDFVGIDNELENIAALNLVGTLNDEVEQIKDAIMMMDYDGAMEHIRNLLKNA